MELNKKPEPHKYQVFDIENFASEHLDAKMARNIMNDFKKNLAPGGIPNHKPLLVPSNMKPVKKSNVVKSNGGS